MSTEVEVSSESVRLTVLSPSLGPSALVELIGVVPEESWEAGSKYVQDGRVIDRERPFNGVRFGSRLPASDGIPRHIADIADRFRNEDGKISDVARLEGISRCIMSVGIFESGSDNVSIGLDHASISAIASLGAELLVDFYS